jgi:hypothetical protein
MIRLNTATRDRVPHHWRGTKVLHLYQDCAPMSLCGALVPSPITGSPPGDGRPMCVACAREAVRREAEDDGR